MSEGVDMANSAQDPLFAVAPLREAMRVLVRGFGSSEAEVAAVADNLIEANLRGHDSHGIGMLPRYAEAYLEGGLKPNTGVRVLMDAGPMLRLDGQAGFGQTVGIDAMDLGIARAKSLGCAVVALGNAHHLGRIGHWAEQAVAAGLMSLHFVNVIARPIVAPFGGRHAGFGTNPFTAGVPLTGRDPMILDFATSVVAQGKTRVAFNKGEAMDEGLLLDHAGEPTTDPGISIREPMGAILPFGEHKGSGLAVLCELLGGALAGGMSGFREGDEAHRSKRRVLNGMLTILIDPQALGGQAAFDREAEGFVQRLLGIAPRPGHDAVLLAGEPERRMRAHRLSHGVPVDATTWEQILNAADQLGVGRSRVQTAAGRVG